MFDINKKFKVLMFFPTQQRHLENPLQFFQIEYQDQIFLFFSYWERILMHYIKLFVRQIKYRQP